MKQFYQNFALPQLLDLSVPDPWSCLSTLNVKESDCCEHSPHWGLSAAVQMSAGEEGGWICLEKGCDQGVFPIFKVNVR